MILKVFFYKFLRRFFFEQLDMTHRMIIDQIANPNRSLSRSCNHR